MCACALHGSRHRAEGHEGGDAGGQAMKYRDLRGFLARLEKIGELRRVTAPVSPHLEMTEICDRVLRAQGPAVLFENPAGHKMPVLANLFGTPRRVALGMGQESKIGRA